MDSSIIGKKRRREVLYHHIDRSTITKAVPSTNAGAGDRLSRETGTGTSTEVGSATPESEVVRQTTGSVSPIHSISPSSAPRYRSLVAENKRLKRELRCLRGGSVQLIPCMHTINEDSVGTIFASTSRKPLARQASTRTRAVLERMASVATETDAIVKHQSRNARGGALTKSRVETQSSSSGRVEDEAADSTGRGEDVKNEPSPTELAKRLSNIIRPTVDLTKVRSRRFAANFMSLCDAASAILEREARVLELSSPILIFGDIHGNLDDLRFFADRIWPLGVRLTPGNFLFLGDYVDRGLFSVEVLTYLLSLKVMCPQKVFLVRGNHEMRLVNG